MLTLLWINCNDSVQRSRHMLIECDRVGIHGTRVPAIRGHEISAEPRYGLNAYACLLSHLFCQQIVKSCKKDWVFIAEDDIRFLGRIDYAALLKTAPDDATLLQLTTLTGSFYADDPTTKPLWTRTRNGFYGTQLYAVRVSTISEVFMRAGIIDVSNYKSQMLPPVEGGLEVADSYTYCMHTAYICAYPFAYADISLGSELHPEHLSMHEAGWNAVRRHNENYHNPYIINGDG